MCIEPALTDAVIKQGGAKMNDGKTISNMQKKGILITLLSAAFITAMSTTVTGNMIPNEYIEKFV